MVPDQQLLFQDFMRLVKLEQRLTHPTLLATIQVLLQWTLGLRDTRVITACQSGPAMMSKILLPDS